MSFRAALRAHWPEYLMEATEPEAYRTVLVLRDIEERDTEEMAALLG